MDMTIEDIGFALDDALILALDADPAEFFAADQYSYDGLTQLSEQLAKLQARVTLEISRRDAR